MPGAAPVSWGAPTANPLADSKVETQTARVRTSSTPPSRLLAPGSRLCYRPNPLAPIRVGDYWIVAVDAKRCLLLLIRSGHAARFPYSRKGAAGAAAAETAGSPLKQPSRTGV